MTRIILFLDNRSTTVGLLPPNTPLVAALVKTIAVLEFVLVVLELIYMVIALIVAIIEKLPVHKDKE